MEELLEFIMWVSSNPFRPVERKRVSKCIAVIQKSYLPILCMSMSLCLLLNSLCIFREIDVPSRSEGGM